MTTVTAMQTWLAVEHEAVWLYAMVGARFRELTRQSRRLRETHLAARDELLDRLHQSGAEPVATELSYDVGPLTTADQARKALRGIEGKIAAASLGLVGESSGETREFATKALRRAALTDLEWGGAPTAFPGLP